jgi:hypothetical protein
MPRPCTVCQHPERPAIDRALVGGEPYRGVARQWQVSDDAVARHRVAHLPERLAQAQDAVAVAQATDLLREVRALRAKAYALLTRAEQQGDLRTALQGVREARACLELLAELEGELDRRATVNLLIAPEWLAVRGVLLEALGPYPAARAAVASRLLALEQRNGTGD